MNRKILEHSLDMIGVWNLLPYDYVDEEKQIYMCRLFDGKLCEFIMSNMADADPKVDHVDRYDVYVSFIPSGSSYKSFLHYA